MPAARKQRQPGKPETKKGISPSCVFLPEGQWATCADFLAERFPAISIKEWQARITEGQVFDAEGKCIELHQPYRHGSLLYYYRRLPSETAIPFSETILYQDEWIVVADKPHYLPVIPAGRYLEETLLVRLKRRTHIETLSPIHRIDRETAGIVVFSVRPETRSLYQTLFYNRSVEKHYEAIAPYRPDISLPLLYRSRLAASPASFMKMEETEGAPNAETRIRLMETKGRLARYALEPLTGKKHQLRVQMAALGIPILNDRIYPYLHPEEKNAESQARAFASPLQLLAKTIAFRDPVTGQHRYFESEQQLRF
ncbi:pseudouridine synthase [Oxalobacter sp. OttesenSCG-928-P03]|nr:pseudouridine synthase [Oxalobacter sp. OttesenSCG-928-P03]